MRIIALAVAVLISASVTAVATSAAGIPPHPMLAGSGSQR
jgi:hypothetical protein